jgi:hypothetical protein
MIPHIFISGYLAGAVLVTSACRAYLESTSRLCDWDWAHVLPEHLQGSEWDDPTIIDRAVDHFDKNGKLKVSHGDSDVWLMAADSPVVVRWLSATHTGRRYRVPLI